MKLLLGYVLASTLLTADSLTTNQITVLAKTFLRDSTELPIDVLVNTVVTDPEGKTKRNAQSKLLLLFKGYDQKKGSYSFRSTSGFTGLKILHDSFAGNFAAVNAFSYLMPHGANPPDLTIDAGPDDSFIVRGKAPDNCESFIMSTRFLYGARYCYATVFHIAREPASKLIVQSFAVDIAQLPAPGKVRYLGDTQIRKIHSDGDVQEVRFGDDARPFLIPKRVTTTIETDRGTVVVTNDYKLHTATKK